MNKLPLFLAFLFVAGCAEEPLMPQAATESERNTAWGAYMQCLAPVAAKLDDGTSPANVVGAAMNGACPSEWGMVFETMTRADNNVVKQMFKNDTSQMQTDAATKVVLQWRAYKRHSNDDSKK